MHTESFTFKDIDQLDIFVYHWSSEEQQEPRAIIQIAHGMGETAARYERFAQSLVEAGYEVYANDHRGHGLTAGHPDQVGMTGSEGFLKMTDAMAQLTDHITTKHPGVPVYLFGHSMGSFLSQQYMYRFGHQVQGVILSGTNGKHSPALRVGIVIAHMMASLKGSDHRSPLLMQLSLGSYNKEFRPNRTGGDWLSRDEAEVDRYLADPFCGGVFTAGFFRDFFRGLVDIHLQSNMERIPKQLPIFVFGGDRDPVGGMGKGIHQLIGMYDRLGIKQVTWKLYAEGRHEMLNEINREEVTSDVLMWLAQQSSIHE
ncbi:Lysophospholipase, alpha-beta hydrolase superfamily [Paenibacillus sp. 1_12]|uniref:alpha/beta hydrolase n=1 Tax=Paenibacillus sp. 1_12 TaxID=1566278 RepID=UPI0008EB49F1|nr:alpha/beta hydrolase [Paenibacillus sp. 1_12]SFL25883.1 Lysophospholipase, alpha-beta hydrolase superfamily [Paenibacillus sp. 1_12]